MASPTNVQEFLDLVDQGIFETQDLINSAEEEGEDLDLGRHLPTYHEILRGLQALDTAVRAGTHSFANGLDLPFYGAALPIRRRLPIFGLLEAINGAHKRGLS